MLCRYPCDSVRFPGCSGLGSPDVLSVLNIPVFEIAERIDCERVAGSPTPFVYDVVVNGGVWTPPVSRFDKTRGNSLSSSGNSMVTMAVPDVVATVAVPVVVPVPVPVDVPDVVPGGGVKPAGQVTLAVAPAVEPDVVPCRSPFHFLIRSP